jgi:uncharacterized membrane protein
MRHPLHPMLVHAPLACWLLLPGCDGAALALGSEFFWRVSALLAAAGVLLGALAASAGALDYARAQETAPNLVRAHAALMGTAWTVSALGLAGRIGAGRIVMAPAPSWSIAAGLAVLLLAIAGAWCGGEMVYGRGIGVDPGR